MPIERTYQEFEGNDGFRWFVEKRRIDSTTVIVREGYIGTQGVIQTIGFDTEVEAIAYLQPEHTSPAPHTDLRRVESRLTSQAPAPHPAVDTRSLYANFGQRVIASFIDWCIIGAALITMNTIFYSIGSGSSPDGVFWFFTIWALYSILFVASDWQATPGKKVLGLIITDNAGNKLSFAQAAKRWVLQALDYTFTLTIGLLAAAFTRRSQTLHDILAGTLVYDKKEREALKHHSDTAIEQQIIQCALRHRGIVTALLVAAETAFSTAEAAEILQKMSLSGLCTMELNENGTVEYHFLDFMR